MRSNFVHAWILVSDNPSCSLICEVICRVVEVVREMGEVGEEEGACAGEEADLRVINTVGELR